MQYGTYYDPELWTPDQTRDHVRLMQKAKFTMVCMGRGAWAKLESEQGRYRFDWLHAIVAQLHAAGIGTVLATPVSMVPPWALARHPNILERDEGGTPRGPGYCSPCCLNAPEYHILAEHLLREMARHFRPVDGVIGWCATLGIEDRAATPCYCEHCDKAFRAWLLDHYKDLDALNVAWGAPHNSFFFRNWNEVPLPRRSTGRVNPCHALDYARFQAHTRTKFLKRLYDVISALSLNHPVMYTVTQASLGDDLDRLAEYCDGAALYRHPTDLHDPIGDGYVLALTRSVRGPFWITGLQAGPQGDPVQGVMGESLHAGTIRRLGWQGVAHGANDVGYAVWRSDPVGSDVYAAGVLDHDGVPRHRFREARKLGEEFAAMASMLEATQVEAKVALLRSFDCAASARLQPGAPGFDYDAHCRDLFWAVRRHGLACDVVGPEADFSMYRVVLAPCLRIVDKQLVTKLGAYVQAGGKLVFTPQAGSRSATNGLTLRTLPGRLAKLVGATVDEIRALPRDRTESVVFARGALIAQYGDVAAWTEILACKEAEAIAEYRDAPYAGKPAITRRTLEKGQVYYLGVYLPRPLLAAFLAEVLPQSPLKSIPEGLEVCERTGAGKRIQFLINHAPERVTIEFGEKRRDLISGTTLGPKLTLSPHGVVAFDVARASDP